MKPINFQGANKILTAPRGMEKECGDLYVYNDGRESISVWELDDQEIEMLLKSRKILLVVSAGPSQPPVSLAVFEVEEADANKTG